MSKHVLVLIVFLLCAATSTNAYSSDVSSAGSPSTVAGDCDGDGTVTIADVQSAINMFLGLTPVSRCADTDNSTAVTIDEVQKAINNFLCGGTGSACGSATPATDNLKPTTPISIVSFPSPTQVNILWSPSYDDVAVAGYEVWRDETLLATAASASYIDTDISKGATYSYKVIAFDKAGKRSTASTSVSATVPSGSLAAIAVTPNSAPVGSTASISLTPGAGGYYGNVSVFTLSQFDVTAGVPKGFAFSKLDMCSNGGCTSPVSANFGIPAEWPAGSYFFCPSSSPATCARMEVSNAASLPDQGGCSAVSLQGPPAKKSNVVFLADNFSEANIATFRSMVDDYRASLLSVSPFAENSNKFNFWKVERLGPLAEGSYAFPELGWWSTMINSCGGADLVVVVEGPGYSNGMRPFSAGHDLIPWVMVSSVYPADTFVHEFGHAFGDLGDEYTNSGVYYVPDTVGLRPNTDVAFCPKWCSGQPNTAATLSNGFDCWAAWQSFNSCVEKQASGGSDSQAVDQCWAQTSDLHNGWSVALDSCDFGTGCRPGTGCFWNARATNHFRPTNDSIMSSATVTSGFNPPSMDALLLKLGQYE